MKAEIKLSLFDVSELELVANNLKEGDEEKVFDWALTTTSGEDLNVIISVNND